MKIWGQILHGPSLNSLVEFMVGIKLDFRTIGGIHDPLMEHAK